MTNYSKSVRLTKHIMSGLSLMISTDPEFNLLLRRLTRFFFYGLSLNPKSINIIELNEEKEADIDILLDKETIKRIKDKIIRYCQFIMDDSALLEYGIEEIHEMKSSVTIPFDFTKNCEFLFDHDLDYDSPLSDYSVCIDMAEDLRSYQPNYPNINYFTGSHLQVQTIEYNRDILQYATNLIFSAYK
jgi:hypothetical protein